MADQLVTFIGGLGSDPDLQFTQSGRAFAKCGLAVERRWKAGDKWEKETSWFNMVVWGDMAENFAQSCVKGTRVMVTGRVNIRSYEKDGETKYVTEFIADEIGVSLRWATAQVERITRSTGEEYPDG